MEKTYLVTKEQFNQIRATWKTMGYKGANFHLLYNLLRSLPLDRGFEPIGEQNTPKLNAFNNERWYAYNHALSNARWWLTGRNGRTDFESKFGIKLTDEQWTTIIGVITNEPKK